jgi:uncharacterized membrane protein YwaF
MIEFIKKFIYGGYDSGDFTYGFTHISAIIFVVLSIIIFSIWFKNKDKDYIDSKLRIIAYIVLSIYIIRKAFDVKSINNIIEVYWPFYLCNINTILLSLYLIFNWKKGKDFIIVTGLIGGIFTFIIPDGIFTDRYLTLGILDSIMSHYLIVVVPLVLLITKTYVLNIKKVWIVFLGLILTVINSEILQRVLFHKEKDYLFFRGDMPFTIKGVPQFIIITSLAIVLIFLVYYLDYLYTNKQSNKLYKQ